MEHFLTYRIWERTGFHLFEKRFLSALFLPNPAGQGTGLWERARRLPLLLTNLPWAVPGGIGVTGVVHEKRPDREMMKPCHIRVESGRSHETADAMWL